MVLTARSDHAWILLGGSYGIARMFLGGCYGAKPLCAHTGSNNGQQSSWKLDRELQETMRDKAWGTSGDRILATKRYSKVPHVLHEKLMLLLNGIFRSILNGVADTKMEL